MNQRKLRKLLGRIVLAAGPLPLVACGGSAVGHDEEGQGGAGGSGSTSNSAGAGGSILGVGGTAAAGGAGAGGYSGNGASGGYSGGGLGGGAGTAQGGAGGGLSCQGPPSHCFDYNRVTIASACVPADVDVVSPEQCSSICNRTGTCPCGGLDANCTMLERDAASVIVGCSPSCFVGRRPAGYVEAPHASDEVGAHFARAAELEALAAIAFSSLRQELAELGAPRRLLRALSAARRDEVRHARSTRRLARRFGHRAAEPEARPRVPRSLEQIALENVVEGCVREAYGALTAVWQARTARDPAARSVLRKISKDEIRHAALSFELQRWLEPRLRPASRTRVAEAKRRAVAELGAEIAVAVPADTVALGGQPDAASARRLFAELEAGLWS